MNWLKHPFTNIRYLHRYWSFVWTPLVTCPDLPCNPNNGQSKIVNLNLTVLCYFQCQLIYISHLRTISLHSYSISLKSNVQAIIYPVIFAEEIVLLMCCLKCWQIKNLQMLHALFFNIVSFSLSLLSFSLSLSLSLSLSFSQSLSFSLSISLIVVFLCFGQ